MRQYPKPDDDQARVRELMSYDILDTPPEELYDELVCIAAQMLDMPIALVSLVDDDRQWFKSRVGLDAEQTSRDVSFCTHALLQDKTLRVPNALEDERFADSPLVVDEPRIRSYYGAPLKNPRGHTLGTLCVIDQRPRVLSDESCELLELLARQVSRALELRRAGLEAREAAERELLAKKTQSAFLASMSHELRTPLSAIIGFTSILKRNKPRNLEDHQLDYLARIRTSGDYLLRLVNDILDLSKVEAGRMEVNCEPTDLITLVDGILVELEGREKKVPLQFERPDGVLPPVVADAHRLRQVVINLAVNAIKFTEKGVIELRLITNDQDVPIRIDVVDTGSGIPPEEQAKIFERHGQAKATKAKAGSWGLGLFLSGQLCELMGFSLAVASEVEVGTTFSVMLDPSAPKPVHRPPLPPPQPPVPQPEPQPEPTEDPDTIPEPSPLTAHLGKKTVLVVDDDANARAILESYIEDFGCRVVAVDSGEQALEIARRIRPDLITLDLMMPGLDGWAVLQALREDPELSHIPVAICSMADEDDKSTITDTIMVDKPVDRRRLYSVLDENLHSIDKQTVLIVEPDPDRSRSMAQWVTSAGGQPHVVASESSALHALDNNEPSLILFSYGSQTYHMLTRLQTIASERSLPLALYVPATSERESVDSGVQIIMQQPGSRDIKGVDRESPRAADHATKPIGGRR